MRTDPSAPIPTATIRSRMPITFHTAKVLLRTKPGSFILASSNGARELLNFNWHGNRRLRPSTPLHAIAGLVITLTLGSVSYSLLEQPFLKLKKRFTYVTSEPLAFAESGHT